LPLSRGPFGCRTVALPHGAYLAGVQRLKTRPTSARLTEPNRALALRFSAIVPTRWSFAYRLHSSVPRRWPG